jgi:hypothetical protein
MNPHIPCAPCDQVILNTKNYFGQKNLSWQTSPILNVLTFCKTKRAKICFDLKAIFQKTNYLQAKDLQNIL